MKPTKEKKTTYGSVLKEIFDGSFLTKGFFTRNIWMILLVVTGILIYIGNHYGVILALNKLDDLNKQLSDVKYEAMTQSSQLTYESRQSKIRELIHDKGLELEDSNTPPFTIRIDDK
jgi:hypothetical protein